MPNLPLLQRVFTAAEPRVRAAAIRTLGHWPQLTGWEATLLAAARDSAPLVRAEAVKSAVSFPGPVAAEVIYEVATRPLDSELDIVLNYARGRIDADQQLRQAVAAGRPLSPAAEAYALRNASVEDLLRLPRTEAVYTAILQRPTAPAPALRESLAGLATLRKTTVLALLLKLIEERDAQPRTEGLGGLVGLLAEQPAAELRQIRRRLEQLALSGRNAPTRQAGYVAWMLADQSGDAAFFAASQKKESLRELLDAVPALPDQALRGKLYDAVRSLVFELPPNLTAEPTGATLYQSGIQVDYFQPNPSNVALETLAKLQPAASGVVPQIVLDVPQLKRHDAFALRFTGLLQVPRAGKYTFYLASDDGSRLYLDNRLLINNDRLQGMSEMRGEVELSAGAHPLVVTYFDNGGGDGLEVAWSGPDLPRQKIARDRLSVGGGETLHDVAIRSLSAIPGHEAARFRDLAALIRADRHRTSAIAALRTIPAEFWSEKELPGLADNVLGYLSSIPAHLRTAGPALEAVALAKALAARLPADQARVIAERLENLDVRIIAIGTVVERMIYDKEMIVVQAGKPVEFRFANSDNMPHNFAIVRPGALEEVGLLAEATGRDPDAKERHYIPVSKQVLLASRLLEPGQAQALSFEVPTTPGVYPYVCTYPGHWRRMYGALYVVENLEEYQADPAAYLAAHPLPLRDELLKSIGRNTEWTYNDLIDTVKSLPHGRSFEVGRNLFKAANCVGCHKLNSEGREWGPDLTKLEPQKHTTDHLLRSILEPSREIADKYQPYVFVLDSGKVVTGMILEESPTQVKVLVDPLAKGEPAVLDKSEIEERRKSPASIMPQGLLNKLTREEILDLIAYLFARGDKKHALYGEHHH
ncbi:MAG: PA14 domain-containing protein [Pirellulales bacterium]